MPIVVQKYGGSSVADVEKIRKVARRVAEKRASGYQVVVVVSAMGDTTDELLGLAKQVAADPPRRELDMLLSCGERISMALLSMALQEAGVPAISFTGSQSGIITTSTHAQARIVEVRPVRILEALDRQKVVIVAGYQGVSTEKEVTTLGRGGSDTTAVALAAALNAEACEIYSDVDGIFSADPRVVLDARKVESLSYEEMQELAHSGARVLNAQAVEFARLKGIVIHARTTHGEGTGSRIEGSPTSTFRDDVHVRAVTSDPEVAILRAEGLAEPHLLVDFLQQRDCPPRMVSFMKGAAGWSAAVAVPLQDVHGLELLERDLALAFERRVRHDRTLGTVTCVGPGIGRSGKVLQSMLAVAAAAGVAVHGVQASPLQISLVVERALLAALTRRLHAELIAHRGDECLNETADT